MQCGAMAKQLVVRLTDDDEKALNEIKEIFGVTLDSEAVRIALNHARKLEVKAK